ncbi:hypothetical protein AB1Y20_003695 [Prymnesium parvum]|uniref:PRA1 family protein n=1 Tax=Prymnesium parvum TaxID=97485 RepID=A0AB34J5Z5_PRYPA
MRAFSPRGLVAVALAAVALWNSLALFSTVPTPPTAQVRRLETPPPPAAQRPPHGAPPPPPADPHPPAPPPVSPPSEDDWSLSLGEGGRAQVDEAIARAASVGEGAALRAVGGEEEAAAGWRVAAELVRMLGPRRRATPAAANRSAPRGLRRTAAPPPAQAAFHGLGSDELLPSETEAASAPPPCRAAGEVCLYDSVRVLPGVSLPPPPPPPPPCTSGDDECLRQLVASVSVWDFEVDRYVAPTYAQMPAAEPQPAAGEWDGGGTTWACGGADCMLSLVEREQARHEAPSAILDAMWRAWEPRRRLELQLAACAAASEPRGACDEADGEARARSAAAADASGAAVAEILHNGREREEEGREEFAELLLSPRTQLAAGRACWSSCPFGSGPCEACGFLVCCRANASAAESHPSCGGRGGDGRHRCVVPFVDWPERASPAEAAAAAEAEARGAWSPRETVREALLDAIVEPQLAGEGGGEVAEEAAASMVAQDDGKPWWWSAGRLKVYQGGDLETPGELRRAVRARSWRREIVLTYANEAGTAWVSNLALGLRRAGVEHLLIITLKPQHCKALAKSSQQLSCSWSSWQMPKCATPSALRTLWYLRHHYMSRILSLGRYNVMMLDGDFSVQRSPYPVLKAPPLARHNLIFSLDHSASCDNINIGFIYCQGCAANGRAKWVFDETIRRERAMCHPHAALLFGDNGSFWRETDAARITSAPHKLRGWASARDQKVMSDVVASSCCGRQTYAKMLPATTMVLDRERYEAIFKSKNCADMHPEEAGGVRTYFHSLDMHGGRAEDAAMETVAVTPSGLLDSWHGTGAGEVAGWTGRWLFAPPALAHFVGGDPAGGKVNLMQGIGWWHYEADEVVQWVRAMAGLPKSDMSVRGALPPQLLQQGCGTMNPSCWAYFTSALQEWQGLSPEQKHIRSRRSYRKSLAHMLGLLGADENSAGSQLKRVRLIALSGPGAAPIYNTSAEFLAADLRTRARLAAIGTLLSRAPVRPRVQCDSPWAVRMQGGVRGVAQVPGERWPFAGVGINLATCAHRAPSEPQGIELCCSAIYGRKLNAAQLDCIASVHPAFLEYTLAAMQSSGQTPLEVRLSELPRSADGRLDASPLLRYISEKDSAALRAPPRGVGTRVLFIRLEHGEELPPLGQALAWVHFRTKKHFIGDCQVHTALYSNMIDKPDDASGVQESISRLNHDIQAVGEEMTPRPKRPRMGKLVGRGHEDSRSVVGAQTATAGLYGTYQECGVQLVSRLTAECGPAPLLLASRYRPPSARGGSTPRLGYKRFHDGFVSAMADFLRPRPWNEFFDRFLFPEHLYDRVRTNLGYYQGNYCLIALAVLALTLLSSATFFLTSLAVAAVIAVATGWDSATPIPVINQPLGTQERLCVAALGSALLFHWSGSMQHLSRAASVSAVLVLTHATFRARSLSARWHRFTKDATSKCD